MKPLQTRKFETELEVRTEGSQRLITGRCVPYGITTEVRDAGGPFRERFLPGAFARSIAQRSDKVRLFGEHDGQRLSHEPLHGGA